MIARRNVVAYSAALTSLISDLFDTAIPLCDG